MGSTYANVLGFSKTTNQYAKTPPGLLVSIEKLLLPNNEQFQFDPCPVNPTVDGLTCPWKRTNFANPPYDNIEPWLRKGRAETERGNSSCFLIPFRPTTRYFAEMVGSWAEVHTLFLVRNRIKFIGYDVAAPFLSCLVWLCPGTHAAAINPRFHLLRAPRPLTHAEISEQLAQAGGFDYSARHIVKNGRDLEGAAFPVDGRSFVVLSSGDIGSMARYVSGHAIHGLVPVRPTSKYFMPAFIEPSDISPEYVAFCIPHLKMTTRRSPFPSMLCVWGNTSAESLDLEPFRCSVEVISLFNYVPDEIFL